MVYKGRKKRTVSYVAIKRTSRDNKATVLREVRRGNLRETNRASPPASRAPPVLPSRAARRCPAPRR